MAVAFIHLFNSEDVLVVMNKIRNLLDDNGLAHITTTIHDKVEEGYSVKTNFSSRIKRFRKKYTCEEMEKLIKNSNFKIIDFKILEDDEVSGKMWINYLLEKS